MITVNELFSGIGSQSAALERLGVDFKIIGIAEIDKYAIKSYEAIHGAVKNYGDISKINKLDYADFWTYSFPCQDISVAGLQRGINENTRSGLLYQVERLLEVAKEHNELPKYLMLENVKNLVGKQFKAQFEEWIEKLNQLGYNTYWQVLNAKNYGIPQNRERVFAISIRKDIDMGYEFPVGFDNGKRLKDILEKEVDEKYYISEDKVQQLIIHMTGNGTGLISNQATKFEKETEIANTLLARDYKGFGNQAMNCVVENKILIPQATQKGYIECNIPGVCDLTYPNSKTRRGRVQDGGETCPTLMGGTQDICAIESTNTIITEEPLDRPGWHRIAKVVLNTEGISTTIHCQSNNLLTKIKQPDFRIRKLTPLECYRLMGFTDEQFHKAAAVNSNSQLYKQAGNSIVVDVLYYLFKNLFAPTGKTKAELLGQLSIFDL